jgi:hypothetical protein
MKELDPVHARRGLENEELMKCIIYDYVLYKKKYS